MRLGLQADADVFDGTGEDGVGQTREGAGEVVLAVAELGAVGGGVLQVALFEGAARVVEGAELDGDAGADADEGRERAFVECEGAFVREDVGRTGDGGGVGRRCLEADFDYVWTWLLVLGC